MEPIPESARYGSVGRLFTVWFTPNLVPAAFFIGTLVRSIFLELGFVARRRSRSSSATSSAPASSASCRDDGPAASAWPRCRPRGCRSARRSSCPACSTGSARSAGTGSTPSSAPSRSTRSSGGAVPFSVGLLIIIALPGRARASSATRRSTRSRSTPRSASAILFAVVTIALLPKANVRRRLGASDTFGTFILMTTIVGQLHPRLGALRVGLLALPARQHATAEGLRLHVPGTVHRRRLDRDPRPGRRRRPRRPGADTVHQIYDLLGGGIIGAIAMVAIFFGTVAVNAMNDYTGSLSLQAAGIRIPRPDLGGDRRRS